jgi:hypothetical protein
MRRVGVECVHQRGSVLNDADPRVAVAMDPPLVTLGQAKPSLQIQVVSDLFKLALADEQPGEEARHHLDHLPVNRVLRPREAIDQSFERLLPLRAAPRPRFEGRGDFLDVLDVAADRLVFGPDGVEAAVDAAGQAAELLLGEPPFCSSTFRWIDARTSPNASAIRTPGGCSGPPWSSLRIPRTAAQ